MSGSFSTYLLDEKGIQNAGGETSREEITLETQDYITR